MGNTIRTLIIILILSVALRIFIVEPARITSESMSPTLHTDDIIFIDKTAIIHPGIKAGDMVVIRNPEMGLIVKRVIATEGQTVEIYNSKVRIDDDEIPESYIKEYNPAGLFNAAITVPHGHVYLLGDNRLQSVDSRHFGTVKKSDIIGIAKQVRIAVTSKKY